MLASMRGDSRWYLEKAQSKLRGGLAGAVPQHHSLDRSYSCPIRRNNTTFSFAVVSEPLMSNCGCEPAVLCLQPNAESLIPYGSRSRVRYWAGDTVIWRLNRRVRWL